MYYSSIRQKVLSVDVSDSSGSFAIYDVKRPEAFLSWHNCREVFAKAFNNSTDGLFLSVTKYDQNHVINFLNICEDILQIDSPTKVFLTTNESILLFIVSDFWKSCYVKRSLFTLLLRMAFFHDIGNSWEKTMFSSKKPNDNKKIVSNQHDVIKTEFAIKRFFLGYTEFIGQIRSQPEYGPWKYGWVEEFQDRTKSEIKRLLIKKNVPLEEFLFLAHDGLAII